MAVRWYLRYGLSYRDVEELLAERGITVDHVTVYRWVQRFTPRVHRGRPARSARSRRPVVRRRNIRQGRRSVDLPPPGDQHGQVIDVLLSERRDLAAARRFFTRALRGHDPGRGHHRPGPGLPAGPRRVDPLGTAHHRAVREQPVETDHGRLKARLRPMRGLKRHRSAQVLADGHALVQNIRRGHYDIATDTPARHRLRIAA